MRVSKVGVSNVLISICLLTAVQGWARPALHPPANFNAKAYFRHRIPVGNVPARVLPLAHGRTNATPLTRRVPLHAYSNTLLRAQILLDRAHFSPGQIDGYFGVNMGEILAGYQRKMHLPVTGRLDRATWRNLNQHDPRPVLGRYRITRQDVAGPFVPNIPHKLDAQASLPCTCYTGPLQELGEKFHASPALLKRLNHRKHFSAGTSIIVPIVHRAPPARRVAMVVVTKHDKTVQALDASGHVLAQYPATIGSFHDPLPIGRWTIKGVSKWPRFHYNPNLFWDAKYTDVKAVIPPGPNNPVGVVWMQLSDPHYGIHGTPDPAKIGHTYSHGCIRMTNWDAWELSRMVHFGTPAVLRN